MYKQLALIMAVLAISGVSMGGCTKETPEKSGAPQTAPAAQPAQAQPAQAAGGEALFKQHCALCHPDGGNIINPKKPLHSKALAVAGISRPEEIVKIIRNPGPGMTKFNEKTISDTDAAAISEYILKTFR
jgi:cytochrome c6